MTHLQHAAARAQLESARLALNALGGRIEASNTLLSPTPAGGWHGSAKSAFSAALAQVRQEVGIAADLVRAAERFAVAALEEVGDGG